MELSTSLSLYFVLLISFYTHIGLHNETLAPKRRQVYPVPLCMSPNAFHVSVQLIIDLIQGKTATKII